MNKRDLQLQNIRLWDEVGFLRGQLKASQEQLVACQKMMVQIVTPTPAPEPYAIMNAPITHDDLMTADDWTDLEIADRFINGDDVVDADEYNSGLRLMDDGEFSDE